MYKLVRYFTTALVAIALLFAACGRQPEGESAHGSGPQVSAAPAPQDSLNNALTESRHNAITRAVARVSPAVVGINVTQMQRVTPRLRDPFWDSFFPELYRERSRKVESLGSGFMVSPDGYIVTNYHVINQATEIIVTLTDGRRFSARLVGSDPTSDISILKIDDDAPFPFIKFGQTRDILVGEWVISLGNPFGLFALNDQPTVTVGVVSATDRDWGRTDEGHLYLDMIQTDAAINSGNSGGPLVNALGEAIGMNTFIYTGSQYQSGNIGIGFAIPIERVREVYEEIRQHGRINRDVWLGIMDLQDLNPRLARALELKGTNGVLVGNLESGSPAVKAGMRDYDVIVALEGKKVDNRAELVEIYNNLDLRVGSSLKFLVERQGRQSEIKVILEQKPELRRR